MTKTIDNDLLAVHKKSMIESETEKTSRQNIEISLPEKRKDEICITIQRIFNNQIPESKPNTCSLNNYPSGDSW